MATSVDNGMKSSGEESKAESPIPTKIQEVLQQFQDRLSEKDVQISELQKKIETLQIVETSGKSQLTRQPSKSSKDVSTRPPMGRSLTATAAVPKAGKHVRSATTSNKPVVSGTSTTTTTTIASKSKSVPTSPSKKIGQTTKSVSSRPPSRQAVSSAEQSANGTVKTGRGGGMLSRTASVDRGRMRRRSGGTQLKKLPGKSCMVNEPPKPTNGTKNKTTFERLPRKAEDSVKNLPLKLSCHDNRLGRSADSLSVHSVDSQGSSAADFVSVSSGASPSPTASVEGHPLNSDEIIPYAELALRLKRLTEEHDKLQAQHARLRLHLGSSMEMSTDNITSSTESRIVSEFCSSNCTSDFESDQSLSTTTDHKGQGDGAREYCKEEVLRLRDELLVYQKQKCETEKRLEERFSRIQELLDERAKMNREITASSNRIDDLIAKLDMAEKASKEKSSRLAELEETVKKLEAEQKRLKIQFEVSESQNADLRRHLEEKAKNLKYLERESNEMKDFMQAERLTLSEALSDTEAQLQTSISRVAHLQAQLEVKSQSLQETQTKIDTQRLELSELQMELDTLKNASRDMLLKQGAELSGTSVALSQIVQHLESIVLALTTQIEGNGSLEKPILNGHHNGASVVLPECDQQLDSRSEEVDKISLVNAVLKAADRPEVVTNGHAKPNERGKEINEKQDSCDRPLSESVDGLRRDDSALSINSILADGIDCQLLPGYGNQLQPTGKISCLLDQVKDVEGLLQQLGKLFKVLKNHHQNEVKQLRGNSAEMKLEFESQLRQAEYKLEGLQNRFVSVELEEQKMKSEMHALHAKLRNTETTLELSHSKYRELAAEYERLTDQQIDISQLREQIIALQSAKSVLEAEKKVCADQVAESLRKIGQLTSGKPDVNESTLSDDMNEKFILKGDIIKLKTQLCEKEDELSLLKSRFTKHTDVLQTNCKYADKEVLRLEELLNYVIQVLRNIPDVVSNCESLQKLINHLQPD